MDERLRFQVLGRALRQGLGHRADRMDSPGSKTLSTAIIRLTMSLNNLVQVLRQDSNLGFSSAFM